jgi:hypothetical protein
VIAVKKLAGLTLAPGAGRSHIGGRRGVLRVRAADR